MNTFTTSLVAVLAIAVTPLAAMAQDPWGPPHPGYGDPWNTPNPPEGELQQHVTVDVFIDRSDVENPIRNWRVPTSLFYYNTWRGPNGELYYNTLVVNQRGIFGPPKRVEPQFEMSIEASPQNIEVRDIIPSIVIPDDPPYNSRPGTLFAGGGGGGSPLIFGADSGEETDSGSAFLIGPKLSMPIKDDMGQWNGFGWLPEKSQFFGYGKFLFGEMDIYDEDTDVYLFGAGVGIRAPMITESYFSLDGIVSGGPSYLDTEFGSALGVELGASVGASVQIIGDLHLTGSLGVSLYAADNIWSWGPTFNVGLSASW